VAGRGTLYFERSLLDQEGIELINRTISEEELANLNMRASIVVCPYTSASQSGIPVTSFVFNKPVLATRVDGITEYVIHEETGILVPPGDSKSLADGIRRLVNDDSLRNRIIDNIKQMNKKSNSDWIAIAESTLDVYLNEMQN
jgi:glycosyltransferase involved in cell wall biosynthesis